RSATRLLSGHDEAQLTYRGISTGRPIASETVIVDIGGGSTELVAGGPNGVSFHESVDIGCVRLTERFLRSDPPTAAELDECGTTVCALLAERVPDEIRPAAAIGVAGTITSIAALDLRLPEYDPERVQGHVLSRPAANQQLRRLASVPLSERRELRPLDPERAPV